MTNLEKFVGAAQAFNDAVGGLRTSVIELVAELQRKYDLTQLSCTFPVQLTAVREGICYPVDAICTAEEEGELDLLLHIDGEWVSVFDCTPDWFSLFTYVGWLSSGWIKEKA